MTAPLGSAQTHSASLAESERITSFLGKVYGWMFIGLGITAAVSLLILSSPAVMNVIYGNSIIYWGLFLVTLGMVWFMSARVETMEPATASIMFVIYSALMGAMLSGIFLIYTGNSIAMTFVTTSAMFGGLALFGTITKRSLAGIGQFAFMGLIGIIVASIVGIFWQNSMLQFVISICGVIVFTGLTMYDAQRLKQMALSLPDGRTGTYSIVGALTLYLDFINLFLFLLRLFGGRRN